MIVNNEKAGVSLLEEIIRLNRFDNDIKELFGNSYEEDSILSLSASNLFEVFLYLSGLGNWPDQVFDIIFDEGNRVKDCENIYKKLMKVKEN